MRPPKQKANKSFKIDSDIISVSSADSDSKNDSKSSDEDEDEIKYKWFLFFVSLLIHIFRIVVATSNMNRLADSNADDQRNQLFKPANPLSMSKRSILEVHTYFDIFTSVT